MITTRTSQSISGLRIALGHQARVGKDTFADYVVARHGGHVMRFASGVYGIAGLIQLYLGYEERKDARLLQWVGTGIRDHYGPDIWVNRLRRSVEAIIAPDPAANIIVVDMRFRNELALMKELGFTTVRITRTGREIDRPADHPSEVDLEGAPFDYHITNDGTLDEYHAEIARFIKRLTEVNTCSDGPIGEQKVGSLGSAFNGSSGCHT